MNYAEFDQYFMQGFNNQAYQTVIKCEFCPESFTSPVALNDHTKTHHLGGSSLHQCPQCEKKYTQKANLQRHMWKHTGVKDFPCSRCEGTFTTKYNLENHIMKKHIPKKFIFYKCRFEDCCAKFRTSNDERKHEIEHHLEEGKTNEEMMERLSNQIELIIDEQKKLEIRKQTLLNEYHQYFTNTMFY